MFHCCFSCFKFNMSYHTQTQLRIEEKRKLYTDRLSETLKPQVAAFYKTVSSKSAWIPFVFWGDTMRSYNNHSPQERRPINPKSSTDTTEEVHCLTPAKMIGRNHKNRGGESNAPAIGFPVSKGRDRVKDSIAMRSLKRCNINNFNQIVCRHTEDQNHQHG